MSKTDQPHLRAYAAHLLRLNALILDGCGDGAMADRVRDAMDGPWAKMSEEARREARAFSVRLNKAIRETPWLGDADDAT